MKPEHTREMKIYTASGGQLPGSLLYGMAILSDLQELHSNDTYAVEHLNDVKEIMLDAIVALRKETGGQKIVESKAPGVAAAE